MEQYHIEVLVSGDIAKSKEVLQQFVTQVNNLTNFITNPFFIYSPKIASKTGK